MSLSKISRILAVAALSLGVAAMAGSAQAGDRWHGRGDYGHNHGWHDRCDRHDHGYWRSDWHQPVRYYRPPVVVSRPIYYHPAPVYYHPRPVYSPVSFSFWVH